MHYTHIKGCGGSGGYDQPDQCAERRLQPREPDLPGEPFAGVTNKPLILAVFLSKSLDGTNEPEHFLDNRHCGAIKLFDMPRSKPYQPTAGHGEYEQNRRDPQRDETDRRINPNAD